MASGDRFSSINIDEQMQLASQIGPPIEHFELVDLLYTDSQIPHSSNIQPSPQVSVEPKRASMTTEYKCDVCERSFKEASHFTNHKRGVQCQKSLQKKNSLKKNRATKSRLDKKRKVSSPPFKPYQCNMCGARFCDKGNVQLHLQKIHHSSEQLWSEFGKPCGFACSMCDFWFADKTQLKNHQQQHNACVAPPFGDGGTQPNSGGQQNFYCGGALNENSFVYVNSTNNYASTASDQTNLTAPIDSQMSIAGGLHITEPYPSTQTQYHCAPYINTTAMSIPSPMLKSTDKKNNESLNSKWHSCPDCELKFIDPINLELHIKRKHSSDPDNPTMVECPITFAPRIASETTSAIVGKRTKAKQPVEQGKIDSDNSNESTVQKRKLKTTKVTISDTDEVKCDHCLVTFSSTESMLSHKNTQKFIFCGVCDFSSCSDTQVAIHIYSLHSNHLPGGSATTGSPLAAIDSPLLCHNGNVCGECQFVADTGCVLVQHLECHGPLKIQCLKCSEVKSSYEMICHHIHTSHVNQIVKIKIFTATTHHITVFLTPGLISSSAIKFNPPTSIGAGHKTKKVKLSATQIDQFVCSSCCVSVHREHLSTHLALHQNKDLSGYDRFARSETALSLCREATTVEFACNECGFTRKSPENVVSHIQMVHLSGKLIHVKKLNKNKAESIISNVFTPPSIS